MAIPEGSIIIEDVSERIPDASEIGVSIGGPGMPMPSEVVGEVSSLLASEINPPTPTRRQTTEPTPSSPPACLDECGSALNIAKSEGKTDELCKGQFLKLYKTCQSCIADWSGTTPEESTDFLGGNLQEYYEYCKDAGLTSIPSSTVGGCDDCRTSYMTDYQGSVYTVLIQTGSQTLSETKTESASSETAASEVSQSKGKSNVGLIVGITVPVVLLLIAFVFGILWYRKRQKKKPSTETMIESNDTKDEHGKAQLHSDCLPREAYELDGGGYPAGAGTGVQDDSMVNEQKADAEMAANEVTAHEMSTQKDGSPKT